MEKEIRQIRILTVILAVLLCAVAAVMISLFPQYSASEETGETKRFVYLAPLAEEDYWVDIARGIKAADKDMESDTLLMRFNEENGEFEMSIEDAINAEVDGIIMKSTEDIPDILEKMAEDQIPVIFYDNDYPDVKRTAYVGIDNYQAGIKAMEALINLMEGKGKILITTRNIEAVSQSKRIEGCQDAAEQFPEIEIAVLDHQTNELLYKEKLLNTLKSDPSINAILCLDGVSADITGDILKDNRSEDKVTVAAFDLTDKTKQYLEEGIYSLVIMQDTYQIGYEAVKQLHAYWSGDYIDKEAEDTHCVFLDVICVMREDLEKYVREDDEELEWNVY